MNLEKVEMVFEHYLGGLNLQRSLAKVGIHHKTFFRYLTLDHKLSEEYALIQKFKADLMVEEAIEIADTENNAFKARNQIDMRKFAASKYNSHKFGDKLDLTVTENLDLRNVLEQAKNRSRAVTQLVETKKELQCGATDGQSVAGGKTLTDAELLARMLS